MMTFAEENFSHTALDALRQSRIVVASDGAEYNKIAEFEPTDATTNPSLVYAAVMKPEYKHILEDAVCYATNREDSMATNERVQIAMDRLLVQVGAQILSIIPGRVSLSVDPRLGYSYEDIVRKSLSLITLVEELHIPRDRILVKIPATPAGIHAAHTLEKEHSVHTNLTLIFSRVQAIACAQAGVSVISPFIGRVKDWYHAQAILKGQTQGLNLQPLEQHPGILLVRNIRDIYTAQGYQSQVMAAGFRTVDEIIELGKYGRAGGPDYMTLPPDLLDGLRRRKGTRRVEIWEGSTSATPPPVYFSPDGPTREGKEAFDRDSAFEGISLEKVPEGLAKFSVDMEKLEERVRSAVVERQLALSRTQHKTIIVEENHRVVVQVK